MVGKCRYASSFCNFYEHKVTLPLQPKTDSGNGRGNIAKFVNVIRRLPSNFACLVSLIFGSQIYFVYLLYICV